MSSVERAKQLVKEHIDGTRLSNNLPMYIHSLRVGELLQSCGYDENVQIAGILHDTLEDSQLTVDDLSKNGFNDAVIRLVQLCTHNKSVDGKIERRFDLIEKVVRSKSDGAFSIKVADYVDNISEPYMPNGREERAQHILAKKGITLLYYTQQFAVSAPLKEILHKRMFEKHSRVFDHTLPEREDTTNKP